MKVKLSILLLLICNLSVAQQDIEFTEYELFKTKDNKEKFVNYFNLMPKHVRDFTPNDFFIEFEGEVINDIEIFIVNRFEDAVYNQEDLENVKLVGDKKGKSSTNIVSQQLLFKIGDKVDSKLIADVERNIRENTIYIDAVIKVEKTPSVNGVNVKVYAHDNRHWKALFYATPTSLSLGGAFYDFFGLSQKLKFSGSGIIDPTNPYSVEIDYTLKNIAGSQIKAGIFYLKQNQKESYGFEVLRKFFAYNTKWAGKLTFDHTAKKIENLNISSEYNNKFFASEFWLARSFSLPKLSQKYESLRFIISTRTVIKHNYKIPENQPFQNFVNKQFYLGSFGFANRDWYGFEELYRFRQFDYVPKGFNIAAIIGYEVNQFLGGRYYNGLTSNFSWHYPKFGFMQNELSLGSFIRDKYFEQVTLQLKTSYFTNRAKLGKLGFRQFINTDATFSFNRPNSELYNIGTSAIRGFDTQKMIGTKSFVINLESVFYTPIDWWTSKGNFFFFADLGWIGSTNTDFLFNNTIYQGYGGGIRFQNRTLGLDFMEISFGYYPSGYLLNERNFGYQLGTLEPREIETNNLFTSGVLTDIY